MIELYIRKYYRLKEFKKSTTEDSATAFMRFLCKINKDIGLNLNIM